MYDCNLPDHYRVAPQVYNLSMYRARLRSTRRKQSPWDVRMLIWSNCERISGKEVAGKSLKRRKFGFRLKLKER